MNLKANHRDTNTYGNMRLGNFGVGQYATAGVNLSANHMNTYEDRGVGNFGDGHYATWG